MVHGTWHILKKRRASFFFSGLMIIISKFGSMFRRASMDLMGMGGTVPEYGAIFMSNRKTMEECLRRKIFGLPFSKAGFVKNVKVGMVLFLFEYERRELHGVFQASTDGAIDIVPEAYCSSGKQFSAQVRVTTIWNCTPLTEEEFGDAIRDNYFAAKKFHFGLSEDQVHKLLVLFSSKKLRQPQRHLRRSNVLEIVREDEVIKAPESGRFPRSDRVRNDHNMDNNVRPVSTSEYREKSLGKETRFYDNFSTEIPVNYLGDARLMMSNRERTRDHLDDDPGMAFPTKYYGNSLSDLRAVANVDRTQTVIDTGPVISTDYLYKPNLSRLEYSGRAGTPTIHYSGLYHGSDSVQGSPFHPESRGVTRCFDITSGFRNCVSSLTPDDYECLRPRIPMPFSGPGYSESNAVEYSDLEGYRGGLSFAGSSLPPASLGEGENIGPATYSLRPINETQHNFGYPETSHEKNKPLPRSGNSEAYAANVSLSNEVQCHSQGDLRSLEAESITFHENNMSDLDLQSRQKLRGMYSTREKSRNSVFSRLTFAAEASAEDNGSPVDYNEVSVDTSVEEFMTILHDSSYHWAKKWSNSKPLTGHDDNGENIRRKPKTVYSEMERDQGTPLLIRENMDLTLDNGESNCETTKGQPSVHFKRRSETRKRKDEIKMGELVESPESNGMSGTCQKRRKLVRPNFSKNEPSHEKKDVIGENPKLSSESSYEKDVIGESTPNPELSSKISHEKDVIGESTPKPELSSQESSFPEDNTRKSGTLDRNNGNEKEEGPEQAGLLDPFQVSSGQNEALDGNHENDKEGPEQAGLPDVVKEFLKAYLK